MRRRNAFIVLVVFAAGLSAVSALRTWNTRGDGISALNDISAQAEKRRTSPAAVARQLPDIRFIDEHGASRQLSDFSGRHVLLNVWATWCVPCRKEMPSLDALQRALGGPKFEVVALSIDNGGVPAVQRFYQELHIRSLRVYLDPANAVSSAVGIVGIPTTILIGPTRNELWRIAGPVTWDAPEVVARLRRDLDLDSEISTSQSGHGR